MSNDEYIDKVSKILTLRGLTEHSVKSYLNMCERFLCWCNELEIEPAEITYDQVQNYVLYLMKTVKYAPKTINSNISFIRLFFLYIIHRPIDKYMLPYCRVDNKPPAILSRKEVAIFINALPNLKDKAMVTLLYSCGLRSAEVVSLRYKDISRERKTLFVESSKNRSGRYVPLSDAALDILTAYWYKYGKPQNWLFPGQNPEHHISKASLYAVVKATSKSLGWEDRGIATHSFRHAIGTHLYEDTRDLMYIKNFLGHRSITSTVVYVTLSEDSTHKNPMDSIVGGISIE